MSTDPTDRVVGTILKSLAEVKSYVDGEGALRVHIPGVPAEMMTHKDQLLLEDIRYRQQWRFLDWASTAKAIQIGYRIRPDWVWQFFHLDPIEGDPDRKRWVVTAHPSRAY